MVRGAWEHERSEFPMVTSIDPYGGTLMNYLMVELFISELGRLQVAHPEETDLLTAIKELGDFVVTNETEGLFLAFIGD